MGVSIHRSSSEYKNKYTRELRKLLIIRLPPRDLDDKFKKRFKGICIGLTGNFLPVTVFVNSMRRFSKLRGWYYVDNYSVKNSYAVLRESMMLKELDEKIIAKLTARYYTVQCELVTLRSVISTVNTKYLYLTVLFKSSLFVRNIASLRDSMYSYVDLLDNVRVKPFVFCRFNRVVVNCVTLCDNYAKRLLAHIT